LYGKPGLKAVTLFWTAPVNNGGAAITDYLVEVSTDLGKTWSKVSYSKTTTFMVPGLLTGKLYTFKVRAVNSAGIGLASSPSKPLSVL
jgi:titin